MRSLYADQDNSIMKNDPIKDEAVVRKASMILQNAVDSFMEQRRADESDTGDEGNQGIEQLVTRLIFV